MRSEPRLGACRAFACLATTLLVLVGFAALPAAAGEELPPSSEAPSPPMAGIEVVLETPFTAGLDGGDGLLRLAVVGERSAVAAELPVNSESPPLAPSVTAVLSVSLRHERKPETLHIFLNDLRLAKIDPTTPNDHAYDHFGNVRVVISSSGARQNTLAYRPFGICANGCESEPTYGYTGEYRESTPNLIYLHSRWYDPTIGRFISPDDRLGRLSMPQDQNRYAYVVNNPMIYTDPTGHASWIPLLGC